MKKTKKNLLALKSFSKFSLFIFLFLIYTNYIKNYSTIFMPKEYKTIKKIVDKIASKNYLGDEEIPFSVGSGSYMEYEAEKLGLCKKDNCYYFKNLNPYKKHKDFKKVNLNELLKQSYLYNSIEAYAWSGVVWLSKSTFKTYGDKTKYLSCVIGHELSHIIYNDHIEQSIKLSKKIKDFRNTKDVINNQLKNKNNVKNEEINNEELKSKEDEKKDLYQKVLSRESEIKADQNGAQMVINAGFPKDTCLKSIIFLSKRNYIDAHTDLTSTHPGHLERYESLKNFIETYNKEKELKKFKYHKWSWRYNRNLNILTFSPKK